MYICFIIRIRAVTSGGKNTHEEDCMSVSEIVQKKRAINGKTFSSWRDEYNAKLCSAEEAASLIKSNDRIAMSGGTSVPYEFSRALSKRAGEIQNVGISMGYAMALFDYMKPENHESFYLKPFLSARWSVSAWTGAYASTFLFTWAIPRIIATPRTST